MEPSPNAVAAERWNGDSGRNWIAHRERHVTVRQGILPHLWRAAAIRPGDRVLDVGCGCGETTIEAAAAADPGGSALGLDLSAPMLDVARELAAGAGTTTATFVQGDAQVYPFPPATFDVVISCFGVMFFADPAAAFGNLARALRPGGRLVFLCWQDDSVNEMFGLPLRAFHGHVPGLFDDDCPFTDPAWIVALLTGAGFADVRCDPVREPARLGSDVADVIGYVRAMRRIRLLLDEVGDQAPVLAAMADEYAARQRPDGVWVDTATWLVSATAPSSSAPGSPAA